MADWQLRARCRELIDAGEMTADQWFPSRGEDVKPAKGVCLEECPVRAECLAFALDSVEQHGIWGGASERERRKMRRGRTRRAMCAKCRLPFLISAGVSAVPAKCDECRDVARVRAYPREMASVSVTPYPHNGEMTRIGSIGPQQDGGTVTA